MTHIILNILFIIHWKRLVPTEHYQLDFYGVIYSGVKFKKKQQTTHCWSLLKLHLQ